MQSRCLVCEENTSHGRSVVRHCEVNRCTEGSAEYTCAGIVAQAAAGRGRTADMVRRAAGRGREVAQGAGLEGGAGEPAGVAGEAEQPAARAQPRGGDQAGGANAQEHQRPGHQLAAGGPHACAHAHCQRPVLRVWGARYQTKAMSCMPERQHGGIAGGNRAQAV